MLAILFHCANLRRLPGGAARSGTNVFQGKSPSFATLGSIFPENLAYLNPPTFLLMK